MITLRDIVERRANALRASRWRRSDEFLCQEKQRQVGTSRWCFTDVDVVEAFLGYEWHPWMRSREILLAYETYCVYISNKI